MSLARIIRSAVIRRTADANRVEKARQRADRSRLKQGRPHVVHYFHQVDDPYSHLAAQVINGFLTRFDVELKPHVVAEHTPIAIHDRSLWDQWAERECAAMAPYYSLSYSIPSKKPNPVLIDQARRTLLAAESTTGFAEAAIAIDTALNNGDETRLEDLAKKYGVVDQSEADKQLKSNFKLRHRLGHYLGAMFYYEGEWYWGIDRLHYLEARLDALGARRKSAPTGLSVQRVRHAPTNISSQQRVRLEFFPSLRSPYTHIAYDQIADLCKRYPIDLECRPVLPMMMRGVKADRRKGMYIISDTKREADRLGIPFGNTWDPFGNPVRRGYSLFPWARDQGKGFEYLYSFSRAVWSERINAWSKSGLKLIVERAGLSWDEALQHLDNREWEPELEKNVNDMIAAGSWGVPTMRLTATDAFPEFTVWGQDRIWLLEEEMARRFGPSVMSSRNKGTVA